MFEAKIIAIFDKYTPTPRFFIQNPEKNQPQEVKTSPGFTPEFQSMVQVEQRNEKDKSLPEILPRQKTDT